MKKTSVSSHGVSDAEWTAREKNYALGYKHGAHSGTIMWTVAGSAFLAAFLGFLVVVKQNVDLSHRNESLLRQLAVVDRACINTHNVVANMDDLITTTPAVGYLSIPDGRLINHCVTTPDAGVLNEEK